MNTGLSALTFDLQRLEALRRLRLLDSAPEATFDRFTRLAARLLQAPIALISLVEADRVFFKSALGLPEPWASSRQTPLSHAFCQHTLGSHEPLVIGDARNHPLVCDSLAIPELGIVSYVGIPLITSENHQLGTLCVMDQQCRKWAEADVALLQDLAGSVVTEIELRNSIHQHETARRAFQQEQYLNTALLDTANAYVLVVDQAGRVVRLSRACKRMLGYKPMERRDLHVWELGLQPEESAYTQLLFMEQRFHDIPAAFQHTAIAHDGTHHQIAWSTTTLYDVSGQPNYVLAIGIDITDRAEAETMVQHQRDFALQVLNTMGQGLTVTSIDQVFEYVNPAFARMLGYTTEALIGRSGQELTFREEHKALSAHDHQIPEQLATVETTLTHSDGHHVDALVTRVPRMRDGSVIGSITVVSNLTERRRAEAALRESESRFRSAFSRSPIGIALVAPDGRWLQVNQRLCDIVGYSEQELLATSFQAITYSDDLSTDLEYVRQILAGERDVYEMEKRYVHKHGHLVWALLSVALVRDSSNQPLYFISQIQDISERKATITALHTAHQRLNTTLESITDAFFAVDHDWQLTYLNRQAEHLLGRPDRILLGRPIWEGFSHAVGNVLYNELQGVITQGGQAKFEIYDEPRNRWLDVRAYPSPDGISVYLHDITERKQADSALQRLAEQRRTLLDVSHVMFATLAVDTIPERAVQSLRALLHYDTFGLYMLDEAAGLLRPFGDVESDRSWLQRERWPLPVDGSISGSVARAGVAELANNAHRDPRSWYPEAITPVSEHLLSMPIKTKERTFGVANISRAYPPFTSDEFELAQLFVSYLASALENAQLYATKQRQAQELTLLDQVRTALAREIDLLSLFRVVVESITESFGYTLVSLYLLQEQTLVLQHQVGYTSVLERVPLGTGVMSRVVENAEAVLLEDVSIDPEFLEAMDGIISEVSVPLVDQGRVVGTLNVESAQGQRLGVSDLRLVQAIAEHVNVAIGRARLYTAVREREQQYRSVVDHVKEVIFQTDRAGNWTFLNPAWTEITGFAVDETLGHEFSTFVYPDDRQRAVEIFTLLLNCRQNDCRLELRYLTKAGGIRWIELYARATFDNGAAAGMAGTLNDVTERHQAEEAIRQANNQLERRVDERTRELSVANERLHVELTERQRAEEALDVRLRHEAEIAACSQALLAGSPSLAIPQALQHLLAASEVSRVYIFENFVDPHDGLCSRQTYEACAPGVPPEIENPDLQHLPYADVLPRWRDQLAQNGLIHGLVETFPAAEREILEPQGIRAILVLPIWVGQEWYGFIGFDDTLTSRLWSDEDVRLLRTAADMIGVYLERCRAEDALRESEERFRQVAEHVNEVFWILDVKNAQLLYTSPAYETIWGRSCSELYKSPLSLVDTVIAEDQAQFRHNIQRQLMGETTEEEYRIRRPDGSIRWISHRSFPIHDDHNQVYRVVGVARDATLRKQTEESIRQAEQRYRELFEDAPAMYVVTDAATVGPIITDCNEQFLTTLGYSRAEVINRPITDFYSNDSQVAFQRGAYQNVLKGESVVQERELVARDGRQIASLLHARPELDVNHNVRGTRAMYIDITERNRMEAILRDKEAVEEANRAKSTFLANMSHELRTPLTAIIGYSELIAEALPGAPIEQIGRDLQRIHSAGTHLLSLINDILDVSKIEAGRMEMVLEPIHVGQLLDDVVYTVQPLIQQQQNELVVQNTLTQQIITSDLTRVRQIMINLLSNAAKFTDRGRVTLLVTEDKATDVPMIRFAVQDTGIGLTQEQIGRLFQAFTQADSSITRRYGGTGLGLALCRRLSILLGGNIEVESTPDVGSTFTVSLPRHGAAQEPMG